MSIAQTAARLLEAYGEPISIVFPPATPAFDPVTGEPQTPSSDTTITGNGYPSSYRDSEIDGDVIQVSDVRLILEKVTTRPEVNASAIVDGTTYRIQAVQNIRKTGEDVIYICQLRAN